MSVSVKLNWRDGLRFNAESADGRAIELNSTQQMRSAFTPMELFLVALAGCTAMDVIWILERQRQKINKLELFARGIRRDEDPRYYETIELEYRLEGENLQKNAVERAIRLSQEKYCSVKAMIKDSVKVNVTYSISGGEESEQKYVQAATPRA